MLDIELDGIGALTFRQNGENLRYHFGSSGRFIILRRVLPRDLGEPEWFLMLQTLQNQLVPLLSHHLGYPYGLLGVSGSFPCFVEPQNAVYGAPQALPGCLLV